MHSPQSNQLRTRAEELLRAGHDEIQDIPVDDIKELIHELQVHQIELEMQNEELRRTQIELEDSRNKYFDLFDLAPIGYFTLGQEGLIQEANVTAADLLGVERRYLMGRGFSRFIAPDFQDVFYHHRKKAFETRARQSCELKLFKKDGTSFHVQVESVAAQDAEGNFNQLRISINDITERKRAEEALQKSEAQIQLIVNNLPYVIFQIDKDLKIIWTNKVAREMNPDAVGQPCYKVYVHRDKPCEDCNSLTAMSTGQIVTCTMHHPKVEGIQGESYWEQTAVPLRNDQGEVIGAIEFANNITERKRLEVQLQQAQKMKAVATLAGGIAHEFNNALVGISGNIELLQMDLRNGENIDRYVQAMQASTRRMAGLTNQLLAYARGGRYQPKIISLNDLVEDTVPLIQHDIDSHIRVETDLADGISRVEADFTQIQMVLSAVLNNAAEAIQGEGRIRIITRDEKIDKEFVETRPYFKPGHYVCLTIEDEGKGMDEETRSGVFEPFFTTKFQGRGLGMAAVYGIIKNHGGSTLVNSELGKGTTVRIYLPSVEAQVEQPRAAKVGTPSATGTILVIEDEDVVIDVLGPMLERLGYDILVAKTGKEAVDIAKNFDGRIDLAILDIVLPDIGGRGVYPLIMEARPNLKVIVCSGYDIEGPAQEILDTGAQDFIQKPFSLQILSEKLKEMLGGQTGN